MATAIAAPARYLHQVGLTAFQQWIPGASTAVALAALDVAIPQGSQEVLAHAVNQRPTPAFDAPVTMAWMPELSPELLRRQDESADELFYVQPRLLAHIDEEAIAALGRFLRDLVPEDAEVLDLMSAYVSHLPEDVLARCKRVAGLGMNEIELAANSQLTDHLIHNLNTDPHLPFEDARFDVALCTVSVQYLLHSVEVFGEVSRVLRPGAPFVVSFSNRCFPTKAISAWLYADDRQHRDLVHWYFDQSAGWRDVEAVDLSPNPGLTDPLYVVWGRKGD
jgi:SAM-dependent methyltransferase